MNRYIRQTTLKEIGEDGQEKLLLAKVLIVGVGGLGCPVLTYLSAAGVGTIGIIDFDKVDITNLHRQVLYNMADIGKFKTERATYHINNSNPEVNIIQNNERLTPDNVIDLISNYDIVVDTSDNFPTRYLVNDACVHLNKTLVYGAVSKFEGQVAVFNGKVTNEKRATNYRDLFPIPPKENEIENCEEGGVIGVLPGIIGTLQAGEVIKMITNIGNPLYNKLQTFNLLTNEWNVFDIPTLNSNDDFKFDIKNDVYLLQCETITIHEIGVQEFSNNFNKDEIQIIDVREKNEIPLVSEFNHINLPLSILEKSINEISKDTIITFCQTGKRSKQAAQFLSKGFPNKRIYNLKNGIVAWKEFNSKIKT